MKKTNIFAIALILIVTLGLYINSRLVTEVSFSQELMKILPGCEESQNSLKDSYTMREFEEMKERAELCSESKLQYLKTNTEPNG